MLPLQHRTMVSRDGRTRTDDLVFPKHAGLPLPCIPSVRTAGFEPRAPTRSVGRSWPPDQRCASVPARYQASPRSKKVSFSASSIPTGRWPSLQRLSDSTRSAHGRVKPFIAFTPVVGVSTAQQQAVVQRVFWVRIQCPVEHSHLARPAFCSGKQSPGPLSGNTDTFRRPL